MTPNINFRNIRIHKTSQKDGFEELICQIARKQKTNNAKQFIRKDGSGGDGGVECYWILDDDSEHCWQAKYFIDKMDDDQFKQIEKSFVTALDKHDNMIKYIVCISRNLTNGQRKNWDKYVQKWELKAKSQKKNIEIELWDETKIIGFLNIDDADYAGLSLYWFNEKKLRIKDFKKIVDSSKKSLGNRYTLDIHVELPIAKELNAIGLNSVWREGLYEKIKAIKEKERNFHSTFNQNNSQLTSQSKQKIEDMQSLYSSFISGLDNLIDDIDFFDNLDAVEKNTKQIIGYRYDLEYQKNISDGGEYRQHEFLNFIRALEDFYGFLIENGAKAGKTKAAILSGDPGTGKSHLLCHISSNRITENLPTVFLLGQHYEGGDPIDFIKKRVGLEGYNNNEVLGAINATGESYDTIVLIIIDAINEGSHRDDWNNHLGKFIEDLKDYKHIAIILSIRNTYYKYILPHEMAEDESGNDFIRINHKGFKGYLHRASSIYFEKYGISKPSAPILDPEFNNPLFLKICCEALHSQQKTEFPKDLKGITNIFNFYIEALEKIINKKKKYSPSENVVKKVLTTFSSNLLPDNLSGIPIDEAQEIIEKHDTNSNIGDRLFNEFLNEGILSEDIAYIAYSENHNEKIPVIRFTYERFSDYFVAQEIMKKYSLNNIEKIFSEEETIAKEVFENQYKFQGIIEIIGVIIAEKYDLEILDLIPTKDDRKKDVYLHNWGWDMFKNTLISRSADAFSNRTLKIFNEMPEYIYNDTRIDILLQLSTEPNHPWNANLLNSHLAKCKNMAERDAFWSTQIALNDYEESGDDDEYYQEESMLRTLLNWSHSGNIEQVDEDRIRLCAITLLWYLTTSNRKVRDQATKSLVRMLSQHYQLLPKLIEDFHEVNDIYLVERLFAVAYGVACNINDDDFIIEIAKLIYGLVFDKDEVIPHILLRDYARGVLELASHKRILPNYILPDKFRPPYNTRWPDKKIEDKIIKDTEKDNYSRNIISSVLSGIADFGNYTMGSVHEWSATPLSEGKVMTFDDFKKEFKKTKKTRLGVGKEEYERWMNSSFNGVAKFSRKWAQRWVFKRSHEFGWEKDLFGKFEETYCRNARWGRNEHIERIGKKYQWIAYHEFLAYLSDHFHWADDDRHCTDYDKDYHGKYNGPWQIHRRDIDPTIWIKSTYGDKSFDDTIPAWWKDYKFPITNTADIDAQIEFVESKSNLPNFEQFLLTKNPQGNKNWIALKGFYSQDWSDSENKFTLRPWFRINSIIVKRGDYDEIYKEFETKNLEDPFLIRTSGNNHQSFLGEYPWHPSYRDKTNWMLSSDPSSAIPFDYFIPISEYQWEEGGLDYSIDKSISFYLPAIEFVRDFNLSRQLGNFTTWFDKNENDCFINPIVNQKYPDCALFDKEKLLKWLDDNNYEIMWLIGGEKQLFKSSNSNFSKRLTFNGIYRLKEGQPIGKFWFK